MNEVSVVIPVGPSHLSIVERAHASAKKQTVPVDVFVIVDNEKKGPAWARNRGLEKVQTRWVIFLDADDELEPRFAEECLQAGAWPNRYVYTDWFEGETQHCPPDHCWTGEAFEPGGGWKREGDKKVWHGGGAWHVVTTLLPAHWVRHIDGFDEAYRHGSEDTAFYWKLQALGCCGLHLPKPLFRYHSNPNSRSLRWIQHPDFKEASRTIQERYGGQKLMGCCNKPGSTVKTPMGAKQPGDVLVQVLWKNKTNWEGPITQRLYPRTKWPRMIWVDPADAHAAPNRVRKVETPAPPPLPETPAWEEASIEETKPITTLTALGHAMGIGERNNRYRPQIALPEALNNETFIRVGQKRIDDFWEDRWGIEDD
jgi:hypothetical protein